MNSVRRTGIVRDSWREFRRQTLICRAFLRSASVERSRYLLLPRPSAFSAYRGGCRAATTNTDRTGTGALRAYPIVLPSVFLALLIGRLEHFHHLSVDRSYQTWRMPVGSERDKPIDSAIASRHIELIVAARAHRYYNVRCAGRISNVAERGRRDHGGKKVIALFLSKITRQEGANIHNTHLSLIHI